MKPERRSMTAAIQSAVDLPPEAIALIKAGTPKPLSTNIVVAPPAPELTAAVPVPELTEPRLESPLQVEPGQSVPFQRKPRGRPKGSVSRPVETVGRLVGTSYRLPEDLVFRVMKASAERKIGKIQPWAQQDIVAEALNAWLKSAGY
jgi:hypothetical protein